MLRILHIISNAVRSGYFRAIAEAAADIFVHPSLTEAFSHVLIEAAAAGKPVVSTDVGGAREVIEEGATGRIVPIGNSEALTAALTDLLDHVHLWSSMGDKGRQRVQVYTARRMMDFYERYYLQWFDERRSRLGALGH